MYCLQTFDKNFSINGIQELIKKMDLAMKIFILFIFLIFLVSCGKSSGNGNSSTTKNQNPVITDLMDLAGEEFNQQTVNGVSNLYFYQTDGGEITVFLNYGGTFAPLEEYTENSLKVVFRFEDYRQIEDDLIELSKIKLTSDVFVRNCSICNSYESYRHTIEGIEKFHYDILQGKETIKVRIIKNLKKNQFYMSNFGEYFF